jgi:hypothetical protein
LCRAEPSSASRRRARWQCGSGSGTQQRGGSPVKCAHRFVPSRPPAPALLTPPTSRRRRTPPRRLVAGWPLRYSSDSLPHWAGPPSHGARECSFLWRALVLCRAMLLSTCRAPFRHEVTLFGGRLVVSCMGAQCSHHRFQVTGTRTRRHASGQWAGSGALCASMRHARRVRCQLHGSAPVPAAPPQSEHGVCRMPAGRMDGSNRRRPRGRLLQLQNCH